MSDLHKYELTSLDPACLPIEGTYMYVSKCLGKPATVGCCCGCNLRTAILANQRPLLRADAGRQHGAELHLAGDKLRCSGCDRVDPQRPTANRTPPPSCFNPRSSSSIWEARSSSASSCFASSIGSSRTVCTLMQLLSWPSFQHSCNHVSCLCVFVVRGSFRLLVLCFIFVRLHVSMMLPPRVFNDFLLSYVH